MRSPLPWPVMCGLLILRFLYTSSQTKLTNKKKDDDERENFYMRKGTKQAHGPGGCCLLSAICGVVCYLQVSVVSLLLYYNEV